MLHLIVWALQQVMGVTEWCREVRGAHLKTPNCPAFTFTATAPCGHGASALQSFISTNNSASSLLDPTAAYVTGIHHAYLAGASVKPPMPVGVSEGSPMSGVSRRSVPHMRACGPSCMPNDIVCCVSRSFLPSSERAAVTRGDPCWLVQRCIHASTGRPLELDMDCQRSRVSPVEYLLLLT
jgi:hypothetical protein